MAKPSEKKPHDSKPHAEEHTNHSSKKHGRHKSHFEPQPPALIPEKYQDPVALGSLLLLLLLFFAPAVFGGKVFLVPDNTASQAFETLLNDAKEQGIFPLWIPYIFSGMPAYGSLTITGERGFDFINGLWTFLIKVFTLPFANPEAAFVILHFFLFGAGVYALLRYKGMTPFHGFVAAIGASFATLSIQWITVGHNTKMIAIAMIPFSLIFIERLRAEQAWKKNLLNVALLAIVLNIQARSVHPQMMFYSYLAIGVYFAFEFATSFLQKSEALKEALTRWGRSAGGFALALLLAISFSADTYLSVWEYKNDSIRGKESIVSSYPELKEISGETEAAAKKASGGIDYDYATNWSFGVSEVITFFAPSYYGFGNDSYWGPQPFTAAPQFFGTVILILSIIGIIRFRKDHFVLSLVAIGGFALLVSFGKYMPLLFDPMFYYLPIFNKFRAPSMILCLLLVSAVILSGYGLKAIYDARAEGDETLAKYFRWAAYAGALLLAFGVLGLSSCKEDYVKSIAQSDKGKMLIQQYKNPQVIGMFNDQLKVFENMKSDFLLSLFILASLLGITYFYVHRKIPKVLFQSVFIVLLFIDFSRTNSGMLDSLRDAGEQKTAFSKPDYISSIQSDSSAFRILPLIRETDANWFAYHRLESVGGYQGAKLRNYQDLIELFGNGNTESPSFFQYPVLLDLLNVKYLIVDQPAELAGFQVSFQGQKTVLKRDNPKPRAWFLGNVEQKPDHEVLQAIAKGTFDPAVTAYLESELPAGVLPPSPEATVDYKRENLNQISFQTRNAVRSFLFVSEVNYRGWVCTIDGNEVPIYKTNYAFQGVTVPEGEHTVKFTMTSAAFTSGKAVSIVANILIFGMLALSLWFWRSEKSSSKTTTT
ncbi:MAG: hypothetical protein SFU91_04525 [Chloroherpetonaceae bacterium]|nr:hypothetical protein [Chloroherpetonaceae bacterium]